MISVSVVPTYYPECCLSISEALLSCIARCLREITESVTQKIIILSVGCGTGFLEAQLTLFLQECGFLGTLVEGVEVTSADVKHLSSELVSRVTGTSSVSHRAGIAEMLLFIYPRDGDLVRRYLTQFDTNIRLALWLGPWADWIEQKQVLESIPAFDGPHMLRDAALATYEVAFLFRNQGCSETIQRARKNRTASEERLELDIDSI